MRPNGTVGWVPRSALDKFHAVRTFLDIDRKRLRATLYRNGKKVFSAPVGVGKSSTPTPPGNFWIRERLRNLGGGGIYGPLAFGTADYSVLSDWPGGGVIGIHGTNQPGLVPGRPSHGCIRMHNSDIVHLDKLMSVGTPLRVR
jgi:lipoprotein-anchoring transpeptidase ErfK/SrfK